MDYTKPIAYRALCVAGLIALVGFIGGATLACDPPLPPVYDGREVSFEVVQLNAERFRIDFDNPNAVRVGVQVRVRIYREADQEPADELVHVYVPANNQRSHNVDTGGCPSETDASDCQIRVTATLLDQYRID